MLSDMNLHRSILTHKAAKEQTAQQMPSQPCRCQLVLVLHMQHEAFWCLQPASGLAISSYTLYGTRRHMHAVGLSNTLTDNGAPWRLLWRYEDGVHSWNLWYMLQASLRN